MEQNLYHYKAHITKVYDGDTVTADIHLGFNMVMRKQKLRLLGIDTPEIRGEERLKVWYLAIACLNSFSIPMFTS